MLRQDYFIPKLAKRMDEVLANSVVCIIAARKQEKEGFLNLIEKTEAFQTFGNPHRLITDKGGAFISKDFKVFCQSRKIDHHAITTGIDKRKRPAWMYRLGDLVAVKRTQSEQV